MFINYDYLVSSEIYTRASDHLCFGER